MAIETSTRTSSPRIAPFPVIADSSSRVVSPGDRPLLAELFADIDDEFFRPHPFTDDEAGRLANYSGRDVYSVLSDDEGPVAYGMLRGWDEGYVDPFAGHRRPAIGQGQGHGATDDGPTACRGPTAWRPHGSTPCPSRQQDGPTTL